MAIDPATAKLIAQAVIKVATDEEARTNLVIGIATGISIFLLVITIPIYLVTHPLESIKMLLKGSDDITSIETFRENNKELKYLMQGELIYNGKLPMLVQTDYVITSPYGYRTDPITGKYSKHAGLDMVPEWHSNIITVADGKVTYAGVQNGYGYCIEIKHEIEGEVFYTFYAHLSALHVVNGQEVKLGDVIAQEGGAKSDPNHGSSTGHHLHFEIRTKGGSNKYAIDPYGYLFGE